MQLYMITFVSDLRQVGGFLGVLRFSLRYNWDMVESAVKHHNPSYSFSEYIIIPILRLQSTLFIGVYKNIQQPRYCTTVHDNVNCHINCDSMLSVWVEANLS